MASLRRPASDTSLRGRPTALQKDVVADQLPAEVLTGLFVGSQHAAYNDTALKRHGITHIISLNGGPVHRSSFVYLTVELRDSQAADLLSVLPVTNCFIEVGRRRGGVLVHCNRGWSRSPAVVMGYLMCGLGRTLQQALEAVRANRHMADPNAGFMAQLHALEAAGMSCWHARRRLQAERLLVAAGAADDALADAARVDALRSAIDKATPRPPRAWLLLQRSRSGTTDSSAATRSTAEATDDEEADEEDEAVSIFRASSIDTSSGTAVNEAQLLSTGHVGGPGASLDWSGAEDTRAFGLPLPLSPASASVLACASCGAALVPAGAILPASLFLHAHETALRKASAAPQALAGSSLGAAHTAQATITSSASSSSSSAPPLRSWRTAPTAALAPSGLHEPAPAFAAAAAGGGGGHSSLTSPGSSSSSSSAAAAAGGFPSSGFQGGFGGGGGGGGGVLPTVTGGGGSFFDDDDDDEDEEDDGGAAVMAVAPPQRQAIERGAGGLDIIVDGDEDDDEDDADEDEGDSSGGQFDAGAVMQVRGGVFAPPALMSASSTTSSSSSSSSSAAAAAAAADAGFLPGQSTTAFSSHFVVPGSLVPAGRSAPVAGRGGGAAASGQSRRSRMQPLPRPRTAVRLSLDLASGSAWYGPVQRSWTLLEACGRGAMAAIAEGSNEDDASEDSSPRPHSAALSGSTTALAGGAERVRAAAALQQEVEAWKAAVTDAASFGAGVLAVERSPALVCSAGLCNCAGCGSPLGSLQPPRQWLDSHPAAASLPADTSACFFELGRVTVWLPGLSEAQTRQQTA